MRGKDDRVRICCARLSGCVVWCRYVKIAKLYLKQDDGVKAGQYINRASGLIKNDVGTNTGTETMSDIEREFKKCHARILERKHRFLEASTQYYGLSIDPVRHERTAPSPPKGNTCLRTIQEKKKRERNNPFRTILYPPTPFLHAQSRHAETLTRRRIAPNTRI